MFRDPERQTDPRRKQKAIEQINERNAMDISLGQLTKKSPAYIAKKEESNKLDRKHNRYWQSKNDEAEAEHK